MSERAPTLLSRLELAARSCARGKRGRADAIAFRLREGEELLGLAQRIRSGTYVPEPSRVFITERPKYREVHVAAYRDRVVHHLLHDLLEPVWERRFLPSSFACRAGKGTHAAAAAVQDALWSCTRHGQVRAYVLQLDIKSFFASIDKSILLTRLRPSLRGLPLLDPAPSALSVAQLVEVVVRHDPTQGARQLSPKHLQRKIPPHKRLGGKGPGFGIPVGNLTSQFFANVYLHPLDLFIKRGLGAQHYVRYVDDFILIHRDPARLAEWRGRIEDFLRESLHLAVHPPPARPAPPLLPEGDSQVSPVRRAGLKPAPTGPSLSVVFDRDGSSRDVGAGFKPALGSSWRAGLKPAPTGPSLSVVFDRDGSSRDVVAGFKPALGSSWRAGLKPASDGVDFVGYITRPHYVLPRRRVVLACRHALQRFAARARQDDLAPNARLHLPGLGRVRGSAQVLFVDHRLAEQVRASWASYEGHFCHADAHRLSQRLPQDAGAAAALVSVSAGLCTRRFGRERLHESLVSQQRTLSEGLRGAVLVLKVGRFAEVPLHQAKRAGLTVVRVDRRRVAGVPWRRAASLVSSLVARGLRVGIALEEPRAAGAVKVRTLRWVITPTDVRGVSKSNTEAET